MLIIKTEVLSNGLPILLPFKQQKYQFFLQFLTYWNMTVSVIIQ